MKLNWNKKKKGRKKTEDWFDWSNKKETKQKLAIVGLSRSAKKKERKKEEAGDEWMKANGQFACFPIQHSFQFYILVGSSVAKLTST